MKGNNIKLLVAMMVMLSLVGTVLADTTSTTVTFVIPSYVAHSVSYGSTCDSSNFFFVESDAVKDGTQTKINVTTSSAGTTYCQNTTMAAMTLTSASSVAINVSGNFTAALPSGITIKAAHNWSGYEAGACTGTAANTTCVSVSNNNALLKGNLATPGGTQNIWWWCDMSSFNSGVATTGVTRTLQTIAIASS
jgi:hypothetical protein